MKTFLIFVAPVFLILLYTTTCQKQPSDANLLLTSQKEESSLSPGEGAIKVEIRRVGQGYKIFRGGKPYYIKGASNASHLELIKAAGGNSVRTYTTDGLDTLLDQAHALDLSVMVGIYVGREIEGFNYRDAAAVRQQQEKIRTVVNRYKNHPAVLAWIVGNEPDNMASDIQPMWPALNNLVAMIHQLDPNHPVTISVYSSAIYRMVKACPDIDFIATNIFGELHEFAEKYNFDKPHVFTEWGGIGPWESDKTYWGAVLEASLVNKYHHLNYDYRTYIQSDTLKCLGSYVFYWGQKQEYTATWFSFFLPNDAKTALVDQMYIIWDNHMPENHSPFLDSLLVDNKGSTQDRELQSNKIYTATVQSWDRENDSLQYHWEIIPDGPLVVYKPILGNIEIRPEAITHLIVENRGTEVTFKTPSNAGAFRLYVFAYDTHGNGAYANMPFYVVNNQLIEK